MSNTAPKHYKGYDGTEKWTIPAPAGFTRYLHREDGPAIIFSTGRHFYYLNGRRYTKRDWEKELFKRGIGLSPEVDKTFGQIIKDL